MLTTYPTDLPTSEIWTIIQQLLAGNVTNKAHATHVGWHCAGYALGQLLADPLIGGGPPVDVQTAIAGLAQGTKFAAGSLPWLQIAIAILEALSKLLGL